MDKKQTAQYASGKNEIEVTRCFCSAEPVKALIKSCLREWDSNSKVTHMTSEEENQ